MLRKLKHWLRGRPQGVLEQYGLYLMALSMLLFCGAIGFGLLADETVRAVGISVSSSLGASLFVLGLGLYIDPRVASHPSLFSTRSDATQTMSRILSDSCASNGFLDILAIAGTNFLDAGGDLRSEFVKVSKRVKIRILLLDPESGAAIRRNEAETKLRQLHDPSEPIVKTIEQIRLCLGYAAGDRDASNGLITVRTHRDPSVFILMNQKEVLFHPYIHSAPGRGTTAILKHNETAAYRTAKRHFNILWGERCVLFDIGDTLVNFDHSVVAKRLKDYMDDDTDDAPSQSDINAFIFDGEPSRNSLLDKGQHDLEWLRSELDTNLNVRVPREQFAEIWSSIFTKEVPGAFDCVRQLSQMNIRVALCSNTNSEHWKFLQKKFRSLRTLFDKHNRFFSFDLNLTKPDDTFFSEIMERIHCSPDQFLLVDDLPENRESAIRVGMNAIEYRSAKEIVQFVKDHHWA